MGRRFDLHWLQTEGTGMRGIEKRICFVPHSLSFSVCLALFFLRMSCLGLFLFLCPVVYLVLSRLLILASFGLSLSCLVLSCLVLSCLVLSCLVLSCLVLPCLVLPCLVLSCLALSCLVLSCLVLSCLVLSCCTLGRKRLGNE
jgi:hypothetical protein